MRSNRVARSKNRKLSKMKKQMDEFTEALYFLGSMSMRMRIMIEMRMIRGKEDREIQIKFP